MLPLALLARDDVPNYERDVAPILDRACVACHGPDRQRGRLRLDSRRAIARGGFSGPAVLPGNSSASPLLQRVNAESDELRMPQAAAPLPADEIELLHRWIDGGAPGLEGEDPGGEDPTADHGLTHWAYLAPTRPSIPEVRDPSWVRNEIDAFVAAAHERRSLSPTKPAADVALLRRLFLDLIGLPPTLAEAEEFLRDSREDRVDRLVERLLDSPHFGEHWARLWLDAARYADTNGFNIDGTRSMWKYRDWVIDAFQRDLPFDQFTLEQLAGDLLPNATESQRIATGFHRNTRLNTEGGVDPEEARFERNLDMVDTTATVWLGTTLGCAQCHSHKYDPFSHREYYQLLAFFAHADEKRIEVDGSPFTEKTTTLVLAEKADGEVPSAHVRSRGRFTDRAELVHAATPAALNTFPPDAPRNRLGLAQWLVDERNPLVARVAVNRIWAALFGRGLVETLEDFGTQGSAPSHPELLDWLASEFVASGWSTKALLRTIVSSSTYRQSSMAPAPAWTADPQNEWLARGARFRMEAERIRDSVLVASGQLSRKLGGPSVFPLQADTSGVIPINKTSTKWVPSPGEDRQRRGIYTFWRRTLLYTSFAVFDAPTREFCTVRRPRTNTPLQALVGWNDPAFFDAARALARDVSGTAAGADDDVRIETAFRRCLTRSPTDGEREALQRALDTEREHFGPRLAEARAIVAELGEVWVDRKLGVPNASTKDDAESARMLALRELAAWTMVANVLLNLDEMLTRE